MNVRFADRRPDGAHALALPVSGAALDEALADLPGADVLRQAATGERFVGEPASLVETWSADGAAVRRVLLAGVGTMADAAALEKTGAALAARLQTSGETTLVIDVSRLTGNRAEAGARLAYGAVLRSWRYDVYRTRLKPKQKPTLAEIVIVGAGDGAAALWEQLEKVAAGVAFTRTLVTEPANIIYPESFVERARALADLGVEISVLDEAAMREAGMGALLGVSQGSAREARLLVMKWDGTGGTADPVALVGKGVTFDTGGISIKPAAGMEDMKWDMGGAGAVTGAMMAIAGRKAKAHVIGVCGLVENMPSGTAQRPGDVVTTMSGQTVEVINTDAEGRLVLCDAITWVQRTYKPKTIVDLATLTGAMIISLGNEHGGLFTNDDLLAEQLTAAGKAVGEKLWRMPLGDPYDKLIDSPIADMKNVGPREGGSITAAQFILRFVEEGVRWAHLDIAGMVWSGKPGAVWDKGATGYGVRLLDRFIADNFEG
ncbi:leucyl aminopeptidase [Sphingomonas quercus]|uniref:Probable cytosol aminopeptidase n=1 Tax=Sphingomonas quercus TaxID=2842451 RepID=A0ABS6BJV9_9SPHN|nr:leucyl aminopeptidase [Sphingomonas quercus]MBU3078586.1 leucyl aminopeptidase [Sphingomonas quercus]